MIKFSTAALMLTGALLLGGCTTTRPEAISTVRRQVDTMERIAEARSPRLSDYEGVAVLTQYKAGAFGFGATSWQGTVYVKDPVRNAYGAPMFVNAAGPTIGLFYGGANVADVLVLFRHRSDAISFAKQPGYFNFTNEIYFGTWGRRQMTVIGASESYYSTGAGLAIGAIEAEILVPNDNKWLYSDLYHAGATVDNIAAGNVTMPVELQNSIARLNQLMKR